MAEKTSLSLSMTAANGDKMTKAVTDVNPAADNSALNSFAQGLAGLTTNTLVTTSKITKQDISGTFYVPQLIVDNSHVQSGTTFTKVDDTHYTFPANDFFNSDDNEQVRSVFFGFRVKVNNVDVTEQLWEDGIWVRGKSTSDSGYYRLFASIQGDTFTDRILYCLVYGDDPGGAAESDYTGSTFYFRIAAGDNWNETVVEFKAV